jgi:U3 small nucleolar RNA-associated protein 3
MAQSTGKETRVRRPIPAMDDADVPEEDPLYAALTQRKAAVKKAKQDHYAVEPNYGGAEDELAEGEKRGASHEIIQNRGLRPHKKRSTKNPRVKKREQFRKAVIRRKGQVRDVRTGEAGAYGGESTGIKASVAKSRSIRS